MRCPDGGASVRDRDMKAARSGSAAAAQRQRSGSAAAAQRHMQRVRTLREGKVTRPPLRTTTTRYEPYGNNSCVALVYIDCACLLPVYVLCARVVIIEHFIG